MLGIPGDKFEDSISNNACYRLDLFIFCNVFSSYERSEAAAFEGSGVAETGAREVREAKTRRRHRTQLVYF